MEALLGRYTRYNPVMLDLKERRERAGLTQAQLAARSGIAQPNISAYESGRRVPTAATVEQLLAALKPSRREAVREARPQIEAILAAHHMSNPRLFGSVARETDGPASDVDLLVDADLELDLLDLIDAGEKLEGLLGSRVDIVTSRSLRPGHRISRTAVAL